MQIRNRLKLTEWWKNFLTGVLATAIGVGLSFEVDKLVQQHNRQQAQRQAAMMAIYDIDETIHELKINRQREDAGCTRSQS